MCCLAVSKPLPVFMHSPVFLPLRHALSVLSLCAPIFATAAAAQDLASASTRVSPGASTRVFIMAAFGDTCQATGEPLIEVTQPPAQGFVSLRPGQTTTVASSLSGKCIGAKVQGTGIYYAASPTAGGRDTFSIRARLSSGETIDKTFQLRIED
jgi:hypothetical protein